MLGYNKGYLATIKHELSEKHFKRIYNDFQNVTSPHLNTDTSVEKLS